MKALFADEETNSKLSLGAVNSINWARILAQITYYFHSYFSLMRSTSTSSSQEASSVPKFVVPTGNFGDVLAGYFAKRMGLPCERLIVATNENDILHRFFQSGSYTKSPIKPSDPAATKGIEKDGAKAHEDGVKETLSPAMDILVSSNFERLLWFLAYESADKVGMNHEWTCRQAGQEVDTWLKSLKNNGGFSVSKEILESAARDFESERVSDDETVHTIQQFFRTPETNGHTETSGRAKGGYVLDPHSAIGVAASLRSIERTKERCVPHISLATAHPAKFAGAVELALKSEKGFAFEQDVLPKEFVGLDKMERRCRIVERGAGWEGIRGIVIEEVEAELRGTL